MVRGARGVARALTTRLEKANNGQSHFLQNEFGFHQ
jgi:hypothetical protein